MDISLDSFETSNELENYLNISLIKSLFKVLLNNKDISVKEYNSLINKLHI